MQPAFIPTHRITTDTERFFVMLSDNGAAYTWEEWNATDNADYEVSEGEWLFQGQAFAGTVTPVTPPIDNIFPAHWQRMPEVIDYAIANNVTLSEAIMQLVNKGLSHA